MVLFYRLQLNSNVFFIKLFLRTSIVGSNIKVVLIFKSVQSQPMNAAWSFETILFFALMDFHANYLFAVHSLARAWSAQSNSLWALWRCGGDNDGFVWWQRADDWGSARRQQASLLHYSQCQWQWIATAWSLADFLIANYSQVAAWPALSPPSISSRLQWQWTQVEVKVPGVNFKN